MTAEFKVSDEVIEVDEDGDGGKNGNKRVIVAVVVTILVVIIVALIIVLVVYCCRKKRRQENFSPEMPSVDIGGSFQYDPKQNRA